MTNRLSSGAATAALCLCAALSTASATTSAFAQGAPVADAADLAFERGRALYKQDKLAEAEQAFAEAWRLKQTQDIAANLGSVELENKRYRQAAEHLAYAVRHGAPTDSDKARRGARERLDAALKFVATIHLTVQPQGAAVLVNGVQIGRAPLEGDVYVDADGPSTIVARLEGFKDAQAEVRGGAGSSQDVTLSLGGRSRVPAVVLGAAGVVGLGLGATFLGLSASKSSSAKTLANETGHACPVASGGPTACDSLRSAASSSDTFSGVGVGALIGGGVLLASGVAYWFWASSSAPRPATTGTLHVAPLATPSTGGLAAWGTF